MRSDYLDIIENAAKHVYDNFLSKQYNGTANAYNRIYRCSNGTIINRPNHGLTHSLRKMSYSDAVINFLKLHGASKDPKEFQFTDDEQLAIKLSLLFSVTGREDEAGHSNYPEVYQKYVKASASNFEQFCKKHTDFNSEMIDRFKKILVAKHDKSNADPARVVVHFCHELDLLRCFPPNDMMKHFEALHHNLASVNNRDFTQLVLYAQKCIEQTGDCLTTKFKEHHGRALILDGWFRSKISFSMPILSFKKRDDVRFQEYSTSVEQCMKSIETVAQPVSYTTTMPYINENEANERSTDFDVRAETNDVLNLIKNTEAAIRLVNLMPGSEDDFAFEMKQICDPVYFRSIKPWHSAQNIGDRTHYIDQLTGIYVQRSTKEYQPLNEQPFVDFNPGRSNYYDQSGKPIARPIHKEEDRGKPKNTIFAKKKAYSLLRADGKHLHFKGTTFKRIGFFPVGIINDIKKMHTHGERYIWLKDVCSDDYFWTGDKAQPKYDNSKSSIEDSTDRVREKVIDVSERQNGISLNALQSHLKKQVSDNAPASRRNEMLLGPSKKSLRALFAPENTIYSRLNVLYANLLLQEDYGKPVPILIIDGEQPPKAYTPRMAQKDLADLLSMYATPSPWIAVKMFLGFKDQGKNLFDALSRVTTIHPKHQPNEFVSSLLSKAGIANDLQLNDRSDIQLESNWKWFFNRSPISLGIELVKTLLTASAALVCILPLAGYTILAMTATTIMAPFWGFSTAWKYATKPISKLCAHFIFPSRRNARIANDSSPAVENVSSPIDPQLQTRSGINLEAVQFNPEHFDKKDPAEQKYIICIYGRDSLIADDDKYYQMQEDAKATNAAVMAYNMPGMGKSDGSSSTAATLLEISNDIVEDLINKGVKPENIVLKGHSLGGGIATLTAVGLHEKNKLVRLFVDRSFSTLSNVLCDKFTTIWGGKSLFKPIINFLLNLAGWNIDSATAWHTIPTEYKEYITIQGRAGHESEEKRYDGVITDSGALHNDPKIKKERKNTKQALEQLCNYPQYRDMAEARLSHIKNRKIVKLNTDEQSNLPTGSHNLSLSHLRLRGAREITAARFFQAYTCKNPDNVRQEQRQLDEATKKLGLHQGI